MTASWGGVGILWNKNVAYLFLRPQRYTKEFIDASQELSISVLPEQYRKQLGYLGRVSGRDEDKIANSGLTVKDFDGVPGFEEARLTIVAKKLYAQEKIDLAIAMTFGTIWLPTFLYKLPCKFV